MKKTRYTEEQIAFALKQAETGSRVLFVTRMAPAAIACLAIAVSLGHNWCAGQPQRDPTVERH